MNQPAFRPIGARYLVLPDELKGEETVIDEYTVSKEADHHQKPSEGTVVAKGNGCLECELGAKVLYGKFAGYEQIFDGVKYVVLGEAELLGERIMTLFDDDQEHRRQRAVNTLKGVFHVS